MTRQRFGFVLSGLILMCWLTPWAHAAEPARELPKPTPQHLPRWRGFNLTEKFHRQWQNGPFVEEDFRLIHELGFNFVRLPMDYRTWIQGDDWTRFNEATLREIDQAIQWGAKYGIHVCINFHRAPGYTVASPPETKSLWEDAEAQRVCILHWATFARRYRDIPNERLSFNLFNEPAHVEPEVYVAIVKRVAAAIRAEDPDRLIISDGLDWGLQPLNALAELNIAQATRGYVPMDVSHYKASWVSGGGEYPTPAWPRPQAHGTLYAPHKGGMSPDALQPLVLDGPFQAGTQLRLRVATVSGRARLVVRADTSEIWQREFVCGPGEGEWKEVRFLDEWNVYQNIYDRDYEVEIANGAQRIELAVTSGDWLRLSELGVRQPSTSEQTTTLRPDWDQLPAQLRYAPKGPQGPFVSSVMEDRHWLWETRVVPWRDAQQKGVGVVVGEFGCFNKTPHAVALAWMEDNLANWQQAGWGWALWNFRGSFGVLDSRRSDVDYESFQGHQLDRKMLDLLQEY